MNNNDLRIAQYAILQELTGITSEELDKKDILDLAIENLSLKNELKAIVRTPKLILQKKIKNRHELEFINSKGVSRRSTINNYSSEYTVLVALIMKSPMALETNTLHKALKEKRQQRINPDNNTKKRLADIVSELRKKFGKEIVCKSKDGYFFYGIVKIA